MCLLCAVRKRILLIGKLLFEPAFQPTNRAARRYGFDKDLALVREWWTQGSCPRPAKMALDEFRCAVCYKVLDEPKR